MKYPGSQTHQIILRALDEHFRQDDRILAFIVFGSVGRGDWHSLSDLDLDVIDADYVEVKPYDETKRIEQCLATIGEEILLVVPDGADAVDIVLSSLMGLSIRFHHLGTTKPAILESMLILSGTLDAKAVHSAAVHSELPSESPNIILNRCIRYLTEATNDVQRERLWSALEGLNRARSLVMKLYAQHLGEHRSLRTFQDQADTGLQVQLAQTLPDATFSSISTAIMRLVDLIESEANNPESEWLTASENQRRALMIVRARVVENNGGIHDASSDIDDSYRRESDFTRLTEEITRHFRERGITRSDIEDAIIWARKQQKEEESASEE